MNRPLPKKNTFLLSQERELLNVKTSDLEKIYGLPDISSNEEWGYILYESRFGIVSKILHIYFLSDRVVDYYIHVYFLGMRIM